MAVFTDGFNRPDAPNLGAEWLVEVPGHIIQTNRAASAALVAQSRSRYIHSVPSGIVGEVSLGLDIDCGPLAGPTRIATMRVVAGAAQAGVALNILGGNATLRLAGVRGGVLLYDSGLIPLIGVDPVVGNWRFVYSSAGASMFFGGVLVASFAVDASYPTMAMWGTIDSLRGLLGQQIFFDNWRLEYPSRKENPVYLIADQNNNHYATVVNDVSALPDVEEDDNGIIVVGAGATSVENLGNGVLLIED